MNKIILIIFLNILIFGCEQKVDIEKQKEITGLSEQLFHKKNIDFSRTLDLIQKNTTSKVSDSLNFADIYSNKSANIFYKVYEEPEGIIKFMSYHINDEEIYAAEYHDNGTIICKFNTSREGIRNGKFECYFENGKIKSNGEYLNDKRIGIGKEYDSLGKITYEVDYDKL